MESRNQLFYIYFFNFQNTPIDPSGGRACIPATAGRSRRMRESSGARSHRRPLQGIIRACPAMDQA